ncbi:MAG: hypothetical protein ACNS60_20455 [Candidatus Cyclobacteriaceae bacterium M2_1C_046]
MKNYLFILFFISAAINVSAADIEITGPAFACPGVAYTYTASASNVFGARDGCFGMKYWDDGAWVYPEPNFAACGCDSNSSTISYDITWTTTGNKEIEFWFLPDNNWDCTYDYESYFVEVRAVPPGEPTDSDGKLVFCTTNETKTISINGLNNTADDCYYHYEYDWIVPTGWSIVPVTGTATPISGGIRTYSTEVNVTSQSTNLAMGSAGNYKIIVKSAPDWPYPVQSERTIWIGSPDYPVFHPDSDDNLEVGQEGLALISYSALDPIVSWSETGPLDYINGDITKARYQSYSNTGTGYIYALLSNSCGSREQRLAYEVTDGLKFSTYSEPSQQTLQVSIEDPDYSNEDVHVEISDIYAKKVFSGIFNANKFQIDLKGKANKLDMIIIWVTSMNKTGSEKIILK